MAKLLVDNDKYAQANASVVVDAYHAAIHELIRRKLDSIGGDWASFVFDKSYDLITAKDFAAIEAKLVATGHRFDYSAMISVRERPEVYKPATGEGENSKDFSFEHAEAVVAPVDENGREQRGVGDNVVKYAKNLIGVARYIRSSERVLELLNSGVPADTVAIIDDSGGTLTAPILEQFKGVICAGTVPLASGHPHPRIRHPLRDERQGKRHQGRRPGRDRMHGDRQDRRGLSDRRRNDRQGLAAANKHSQGPGGGSAMGSSRISYAQLLKPTTSSRRAPTRPTGCA